MKRTGPGPLRRLRQAAYSLPRADKPDAFKSASGPSSRARQRPRQPSTGRNSLSSSGTDAARRSRRQRANGRNSSPAHGRKWYQFSKHPRSSSPARLLEVFSKPELADTRPIFLIHHPELLGELKLQAKGVERSGLRYYTFNDLKPNLAMMERES